MEEKQRIQDEEGRKRVPEPVEEEVSAEKTPDIDEAKEEFTRRSQNRNALLWVLGGAYLVYTGYNLCSGYIRGEEGSAIWFFLIGLLFAGFGIFLVVMGLKAQKSSRESQEQEGEERASDEAMPAGMFSLLKSKANQPSPKAGMSIADRARLAGSTSDEGEDGSQAEEE